MIEKWSKVWVVQKGSLVETPKVRAGFVSDHLDNQYIVTHDDGTEDIYMDEDAFTSCRLANQRQMTLLGTRLNYLRPLVNKMENTLIQMTV